MINEYESNSTDSIDTNPDRQRRSDADPEPGSDLREAQVMSTGQWLRAVLGIEAAFGHDGMPTVWG